MNMQNYRNKFIISLNINKNIKNLISPLRHKMGVQILQEEKNLKSAPKMADCNNLEFKKHTENKLITTLYSSENGGAIISLSKVIHFF